MIRPAIIVLAALLSLPDPATAAEGPRVVASIKPIHSLAAGVMAGAAIPRLLVQGGGSPHSYALKPSDAAALTAADAVFWIGPELEMFLAKPLSALAGKARVVALAGAAGAALLPMRRGGAWEADEHEHENDHHDEAAARDPHLWLDPRNAQAMTDAIAETLAAIDPTNSVLYRANAAALHERLGELDRTLAEMLAPVRDRPFVVFHDGFQYFETRYGLAGVGSLTLSPERQPGPRRLIEIREAIRDRGAVCVFAEPQFDDRLMRTVAQGTPARVGSADPLGAALADGPELYFQLMRNVAAALRDCLAGSA